jgi:hypothetical protein
MREHLLVTLPSKIAESQLLPCEAITMISHPYPLDRSMRGTPARGGPGGVGTCCSAAASMSAHWCAGVCAVLAENTM